MSLGILARPEHLGVLMLSLEPLLVQGFAVNRLAGLDYPVWAPPAGLEATSSPAAQIAPRDRGRVA